MVSEGALTVRVAGAWSGRERGEDESDRIEAEKVGRSVEQPSAVRLDRRAKTADLAGGPIAEDDRVAALERAGGEQQTLRLDGRQHAVAVHPRAPASRGKASAASRDECRAGPSQPASCRRDHGPRDRAHPRTDPRGEWDRPRPLGPARSQACDLARPDLEVEADRIVDQSVGRDARSLCGARDLETQREIDAQVRTLARRS